MTEAKEQEKVTPISAAGAKTPAPEAPKIDEELKKQIAALSNIANVHQVIGTASHAMFNFHKAAQASSFIQQLHQDMVEQIMKHPDARKVPELEPLFKQREQSEKHAAELAEAAKKAEQVSNEVAKGSNEVSNGTEESVKGA